MTYQPIVFVKFTNAHGAPLEIQRIADDTSLETISNTIEYFVIHQNSTNSVSYAEILWPPYGALAVGKLYLEFAIRAIHSIIPDKMCSIRIEAIGVLNHVVPPGSLTLYAMVDEFVEPTSWFLKVQSVCEVRVDEAVILQPGIENHAYIEFVMSRDQIFRERRFPKVTDASTTLLHAVDSNDSSKAVICIWGSDGMDGQKRIWLDQIKSLNRNEFEFVWIISRSNTSVLRRLSIEPSLQEANVKIVTSPYNSHPIFIGRLTEKPDDGDLSLVEEGFAGDLDSLYRYIPKRLRKANFNLSLVSPSWVKEIYELAINTYKAESCDIVVYGNDRDGKSDVMITDAAYLLGIPSATELLNLFPDENTVPTVIIGPSRYAIEHSSIQNFLNKVSSDGYFKQPNRVVISPSVDIHKFDPRRKDLIQIKKSSCQDSNMKSVVCIYIGFVARLSPEKNIGLFVMAAQAILKMHSNVRFFIIGDGILKASLEELTERLSISFAFEFTGWIGDDLPSVLNVMDIIINPSLRGWSETFCIANIEAMSMEKPIVTFAVGGIGEYVEEPEAVPSESLYTVVANAVVVHDSHPEAIAAAADVLIMNATLRRELGENGRKTIVSYFHHDRQMKQYTNLYKRMLKLKRKPLL